jgi:transcriptional regulator with XRE-family HTH domain
MTPEATNLAKFVKDLKAEFALSQNQLAKRLKVSRSTISVWESGHCFPDRENIQKLAALKGWRSEDLQYFINTGLEPAKDPLEEVLTTVRSLPAESLFRVVQEVMQTLALRSMPVEAVARAATQAEQALALASER